MMNLELDGRAEVTPLATFDEAQAALEAAKRISEPLIRDDQPYSFTARDLIMGFNRAHAAFTFVAPLLLAVGDAGDRMGGKMVYEAVHAMRAIRREMQDCPEVPGYFWQLTHTALAVAEEIRDHLFPH